MFEPQESALDKVYAGLKDLKELHHNYIINDTRLVFDQNTREFSQDEDYGSSSNLLDSIALYVLANERKIDNGFLNEK